VITHRARQFEEELLLVDVPVRSGGDDLASLPPIARPRLEGLSREAEMWAALRLATRDYVRKNGFETVLIGLSGGVDSALVAAIAADALGPDHVEGVAMPSRFSSEGSLTDARELARRLGIGIREIPIGGAFEATLEALAPSFAGTGFGLAEENLQARIRGNLLMALSNKHGWMVLVTGNKSESAVGYSTLYGDTAGGFAPIKDVMKTDVYALATHRNRTSEVIPRSILTKPPSAELRPDQTDQDSLPPYEVLDPILRAYVEEDRSLDEIVALGFPRETVVEVVRMVDRAEHKRRQTPPGVKITARAFGKDRRVPITSLWRPR
jgi:NAD+ synthase (glutamine-hydrolysing)